MMEASQTTCPSAKDFVSYSQPGQLVTYQSNQDCHITLIQLVIVAGQVACSSGCIMMSWMHYVAYYADMNMPGALVLPGCTKLHVRQGQIWYLVLC